MHAATAIQGLPREPLQPTTVGVHLIGQLDGNTGDAISGALWKLAATSSKTTILVYADRLRLRNFVDFRNLGESIRALRSLGYDVKVAVSDARLRNVLADLGFADAFACGQFSVDRHILVGTPAVSARRAG
jgi:hypothetical protein